MSSRSRRHNVASISSVQAVNGDLLLHDDAMRTTTVDRRPSRRRAPTANEDLFLTLANDVSPTKSSSAAAAATTPTKQTRMAAHSSRASLPSSPTSYKYSARTRLNGESIDQQLSPTSANGDAFARNAQAARPAARNARDLRLRSANLQSRLASASPAADGSALLQERLNQRRASNGETDSPQFLQHSQRSAGRPPSLSLNTAFQESAENVAVPQLSKQNSGNSNNDDVASQHSNAPSTVWDELGDLKARIRKLELSGNKAKAQLHLDPPADSNNDRPRTGTTQTTSSLSPHRQHQSQPINLSTAGAFNAAPTTQELHPLLHSALEKARAVVDADIYRALESSAADAMELVALCRALDTSDTQSTTTFNAGGGDVRLERRMRRKADNMCRSLTELCIALCQTKSSMNLLPRAHSVSHSGGRRETYGEYTNGDSSPLTYIEQRRTRLDELRAERSRSRIGTGRLSDTPAVLARNRMTLVGGEDSDSTARTDKFPPLNRAATLSAHYASSTQGLHNDERPVSRTNTDVSAAAPSRSPTRQRQMYGRDYVSQHPLPESTSQFSFQDASRMTNTSSYSVASTARTTTQATSTTTTAQMTSPLPQAPRETRSVSMSERVDTSTTPTKTFGGRRRASQAANTERTAPPSVGTGLVERIEAKQATNQMGTQTSPPRSSSTERRSAGGLLSRLLRPGSSRGES